MIASGHPSDERKQMQKKIEIASSIKEVSLAKAVVIPTVDLEAANQALLTQVKWTQEKNIPTLLVRPRKTSGYTYKIKSPLAPKSIFLTINNITDNDGDTVPFEIFFNTKDTALYEMLTALTRLITAHFRRGGDMTYLLEELMCIDVPGKAGYIARGGRYIPSLSAEIGVVIEEHLISIKAIKVEEVDANVTEFIATKATQYVAESGDIIDENSGFPANAEVCTNMKCRKKAVVNLDNCPTCLACGDSKCG